LHNIAAVLFCQRRVQAAVDAYAAALEMRVRCVGFDSAAVGDSLFSLGCLARDLEDWGAAHEYFSQAAAVGGKALGEHHFNATASREEADAAEANAATGAEADAELAFAGKGKAASFAESPTHAATHPAHRHASARKETPKPSGTPVGPQVGRRNAAAAAKKAKKGGILEQPGAGGRDKTPRTIAPPQRRRPEAVRSSWDMEEDEVLEDEQCILHWRIAASKGCTSPPYRFVAHILT
jgi:hypothetical protein